jgi:S1-C subfamily serine protease
MEFGNTVVAGILPATVRGVELSARGRRVRVTISHDSRAFLAILAGSVRRQDLALTFERSTARQTVDFGTGATGAGGDSRMVARSNDDPDRDP